MKKKKLLALSLAAVLALSVFTGCGNQDAKPDKKDEPKQEEQRKPIAKEDLKIGVLHIGDPADGTGYSYAHDQGIVAMQKELGLSDDQIVRKNSVDDADPDAITTALEECVESGCNIIFGTSWGYMDPMEEMAKQYPDIIFSHATGYKNNGVNMNNYFGRIYQARYLTGIAAGMKTKSNKIGYVAAMDSSNAEVTGGIDAFAMGVESVNPDAKIYVKVTNTWFDPTLEGQAADALLDMDCDVIAQHQDTTAPQLAAEKRGVWGCGYNSDMTKDAPKAHLTAPIWNWGVYYTKAVKEVMDGTWKCENYFGGMDDGLVAISPLSANCAPGTQEKIDEVTATIKDGSFKVFQDSIIDNKGNEVCKDGQVLDDKTIKEDIHWYYRNVEVE